MLPGRVIPFITSPDPSDNAAGRSHLVIQVGRDPELCRLRAKVLTAAGHSVQTFAPEEATGEFNRPGKERVWVFCHTMEFYELALMAVAIRRARPADKLLRLTGLEDVLQAPGLFDGLLEPIRGVDGLLTAVSELST